MPIRLTETGELGERTRNTEDSRLQNPIWPAIAAALCAAAEQRKGIGFETRSDLLFFNDTGTQMNAKKIAIISIFGNLLLAGSIAYLLRQPPPPSVIVIRSSIATTASVICV